jgi:ABC-2 type transport system ATP-binding protein
MGIHLEKGLLFDRVKKTYRNGVKAVDGLTLNIPKGCVHAFLGPNGAGKTTSLKAALGFISYGGTVSWDGKPVEAMRHDIVFVPEEKRFYEHWTLVETLRICSKLDKRFSLQRAREYFDFFELPMKKRIRGFSLGMKTSLYLSLAFSTEAGFLILDEPTSGLDPIKRDDVLEIIRRQVIDGKTVLYTSHINTEVERIADTFSILQHGTLVYNGTLDELKERFRVFTFSMEEWGREEAPKGVIVTEQRDQVTVLTDNEQAISAWNKKKECFSEIPTLDTFFQLTIRGKRYV